MTKLNDLQGKTFGNWCVLERNGSTPNKAAIWKCRCLLCGKEKDIVGASLTGGYSTKCRACVPRQTLSKPHAKERIHNIWSGMKSRCYNPRNIAFSRYGGREITVCNEWRNDFEAFCRWAFANGYNDNLTLDRIDNTKGYSQENCRWVSQQEQNENRSSCYRVKYNGKIYPTLSKACRAADVSYDGVRRLARKKNISIQMAFDDILAWRDTKKV